MKKSISIILVLISGIVFSQKIGYVDSDFIIKQLPQFNEANSRLDNQIKLWQIEIEEKQSELDTLKQTFQEEKILLTDKQIEYKEKEIADKQEKVLKLIDKRFGDDGDAIKFRGNSAKPVQDAIFNAIKKISEKKKYNWIVNKGASGVDFLYTDGRNDVTNLVLKELGLGEYEKEAKAREKERALREKELNKLRKIQEEKEQKEIDELEKLEQELDERENTIDEDINEEKETKKKKPLSAVEKIRRKAEELRKKAEK